MIDRAWVQVGSYGRGARAIPAAAETAGIHLCADKPGWRIDLITGPYLAVTREHKPDGFTYRWGPHVSAKYPPSTRAGKG